MGVDGSIQGDIEGFHNGVDGTPYTYGPTPYAHIDVNKSYVIAFSPMQTLKLRSCPSINNITPP